MTRFNGRIANLALAAALALGCAPAETMSDTDGAAETGSGTAGADGSASADEGGTADSGGNVVMNGCGTFDLREPGHGIVPQDPDSAEVIEACTAWCGAVPGNCPGTLDACVNTCKRESCAVCPGSLAPFLECQAEELVAGDCTCGDDGAQCLVAEACEDLGWMRGACGG